MGMAGLLVTARGDVVSMRESTVVTSTPTIGFGEERAGYAWGIALPGSVGLREW